MLAEWILAAAPGLKSDEDEGRRFSSLPPRLAEVNIIHMLLLLTFHWRWKVGTVTSTIIVKIVQRTSLGARDGEVYLVAGYGVLYAVGSESECPKTKLV